jgi:transcriptional regulator with XRE-family HTH domain
MSSSVGSVLSTRRKEDFEKMAAYAIELTRDWSQKELADILGITAPRLSAILNGKANPTYEQARTISTKLNIDPAIVLAV